MRRFIVSGGLGYYFWGSWAAVPFFIVYGVLYGSSSDSRWHECGHRTAFKTQWMNDAVYQIACFMIMREPEIWRWSHTRHHTDTIIVGRDPEIITPRPPDVVSLLLNIFALKSRVVFFREAVSARVAAASTDEEATYVPGERAVEGLPHGAHLSCDLRRGHRRLLRFALDPAGDVYRAAVALRRLARALFRLTQHLGLAEDVLDHRLNSRTVYMNPVFRFLYWNMNYHVEHHIFPTVPYHALPKLHEAIKADCPTPYPSSIAAYREIIPALARQLKDPTYFVRRELPPTAQPEVDAAATTRVKA